MSVLVLSETNVAVITQPDVVRVVSVGQQGPPGERGEDGQQGAAGPSGGGTLSAIAGAAVGGHRMVRLTTSGAVYADRTVAEDQHRVMGLTLNAAAQGDELDVLRFGEVVEPSWNWALDLPVYLGTNGLLTQTSPTTGFSLIVGFPVTATKLFLSIREPITLTQGA